MVLDVVSGGDACGGFGVRGVSWRLMGWVVVLFSFVLVPIEVDSVDV